MSLKTKAKVKDSVENTIQHPSGQLSKQINKKDLELNPTKYINTHPSFYANENAIKHEVRTRSVVRKQLGKKTRVVSKTASNGIKYNIFASPIARKKDTTPKNEPVARTLKVDKAKDSQLKKQAAAIVELKKQLEEAKKATAPKKRASSKAKTTSKEETNDK